MEKKIAVIVILYKSTLEYYSFFKSNNLYLILVDNTPGRKLCIKYFNVSYIPLLENFGIAKAQNIGISKAKELGCEYVVFFDQDSDITGLFVDNLLQQYVKLQKKNPRIAIMGPIIINKDSNEEYISFLFKAKKTKDNLVYCDNIISSGSIVSIKILDDIGYLDESLFIDYVDFELCWRAIAKGYCCCRNYNVKLFHKIGTDKKVLGRSTSISSPFRFYYQFRNYFILCKRAYVPLSWKLKKTINLSYRFFFYPIALKGGRIYLKYMLRGIKDGIRW